MRNFPEGLFGVIKRKEPVILTGIIFFILLFGLGYSFWLGPGFRFSDEKDYYTIGYNLATTFQRSLDGVRPSAYHCPAYPFILAIFIFLGANIIVLRFLNFIALAFSVYFLYRILKKESPGLAGLIGVFLIPCYPVLLYTAGTLYPQTLATTLLLAVIFLISNTGRLSNRSLILIGLLLGTLILTAPVFLLLILPILVWIGTAKREPFRNLRVIVLIVILMVGLWTFRNYAAFRSPVLIDSNSGMVLLYGNSEHTTPNAGVNVDISKYETEADRLGLNEIERNQYFQREALAYIRHNPKKSARMYLLKFLNYFNYRNELGTKREEAKWKDVVMFLTYYPLLVLFLLRLFWSRQFKISRLELFLITLYFVSGLAHAILYTRIRYRLPFDFGLIMVVAIFLNRLCARTPSSRWRDPNVRLGGLLYTDVQPNPPQSPFCQIPLNPPFPIQREGDPPFAKGEVRGIRREIGLVGTRGIPARYGGFETCAEELAKGLVSRGYTVYVSCRSYLYPEFRPRTPEQRGRGLIYQARGSDKSAPYITLPLGAGSLPVESGEGKGTGGGSERIFLFFPPSLPGKVTDTFSHTFFAVLYLLFIQPVDVILIFNVANSPIAILARMVGKRVIINTDGLEWKRGKWGPVARAYFRMCEVLACLSGFTLVSDSRAIADYYRRRYGKKTVFIPYGAEFFDNSMCHPEQSEGSRIKYNGILRLLPQNDMLEKYGLERDGYLLVVGRLEPENNADLIIEAFRKVATEKVLVVVGGTNWKSPFVQKIQRLSSSRVRFLGGVYQPGYLRELYRNCYFYIHGHEVGGTNPALLQAMGVGRCVLALDVPFNREVVEGAGMLFAKDGDDLAEKVRYLLANPEVVRYYQEMALERVKEFYTWEKVVNDYEYLINNLT
ncbi:MAG: DUF1972 domain-containing protein [Candidatus Omnitrophota bacterium]